MTRLVYIYTVKYRRRQSRFVIEAGSMECSSFDRINAIDCLVESFLSFSAKLIPDYYNQTSITPHPAALATVVWYRAGI